MWVRATAARGLASIGDLRAVPALITALGDRRRYVRGVVAWALGSLGDGRAVQPLIGLMQRSTTANVRIDSARALGQLGAVKAIEVLAPVLQDQDLDPGLRRAVDEALRRIGA